MIRWKLVKLPEEFHREVSIYARRERIAIWKVLLRAWSFWKSNFVFKRMDTKKNGSKIAWYVFKLSASVGELRADPSERNLELLKKTCKQIQERLGVNTEKIVLAAEQYVKKPTVKSRIPLNDATKEVVAELIALAGGNE